MNEDDLYEGYEFQSGSSVFPRIYQDDPANQQFTFIEGGNEDLPELYGYDSTTGEGKFVGNTSTSGGFTLQ